MGLLLGAMAAAGDSIAGSMRENVKQADAIDLEKIRSDLAEQKEIAVRQFQSGLNQQERAQEDALKNAPLNSLGGYLNTAMQKDLPVAPAPVTTLSGQGTTFDGQPIDPTGGLKGDPNALRAQIQASPTMSPEDKANALKQLDNQMAADTQTAKDAVAGQTRKLTAKEALDSAMEAAASAGDARAYAAGLGLQGTDAKAQFLQNKLDMMETVARIRGDEYAGRTEMLGKIQEMKSALAEARMAAGSPDKLTQLERNVDMLVNKLGWTKDQVNDFISNRKQASATDIAQHLLSTDPNAGMKNAMSPDDAYAKAKRLIDLERGVPTPSPKPAAAPAASPAAAPAPGPAAVDYSAPARPTTQADFQTLPKGSLYINPSDGKTYRKN